MIFESEQCTVECKVDEFPSLSEGHAEGTFVSPNWMANYDDIYLYKLMFLYKQKLDSIGKKSFSEPTPFDEE